MNRRLPRLLPLLVVPVLLAGCGDGDPVAASDPTPTPPPTSTPVVVPEPTPTPSGPTGPKHPDWNPKGLPPFVDEDPTEFVEAGVRATFPEGSRGLVEGRTLTLNHDDGEVSGEIPEGPYGYGLFPVILNLQGRDGYLVQSSDGEYADYTVMVSVDGAMVPADAGDVPLGRGFEEDGTSYYSFVIHPDGDQKGTLVTRVQQGDGGSHRYTFYVWSSALGSSTVEAQPYRDVCVDYATSPVEWGRC